MNFRDNEGGESTYFPHFLWEMRLSNRICWNLIPHISKWKIDLKWKCCYIFHFSAIRNWMKWRSSVNSSHELTTGEKLKWWMRKSFVKDVWDVFGELVLGIRNETRETRKIGDNGWKEYFEVMNRYFWNWIRANFLIAIFAWGVSFEAGRCFSFLYKTIKQNLKILVTQATNH